MLAPLSRSACRTALVLAALGLCGHHPARAEDGYDLWLRYRPLETKWVGPYTPAATLLVGAAGSPTLQAAQSELTRGLAGLLGSAPRGVQRLTQDGAIVFGTPRSSPLIAHLDLKPQGTSRAGYVIRSVAIDGHRAIVIAANEDIGVLYGAFHFLRLLQTHQGLEQLNINTSPQIQLRLLNHWDNLDGSVERGYAGASIWDWQKLPDYLDPRYID
jgi:alpha-glucuronidase